ncbi:hypothetical protein T492DRAFT_834719 [Pavlovales sp. CCMP2436]|nr:hypothetical protein T492DRAFT_834719 [Pavlovales sp. CCMP2436]
MPRTWSEASLSLRHRGPGAARAVHLAEGPRRGPPRRGPVARTTQGEMTAALLPPTANRRQTLRPERCAVPAALAAAWPRCRAPGAASSGAHLRPTRRAHLAHRSGRSRASLRLLAPLWGCSRVDALDTRPGRRLCPPPTLHARPRGAAWSMAMLLVSICALSARFTRAIATAGGGRASSAGARAGRGRGGATSPGACEWGALVAAVSQELTRASRGLRDALYADVR